MSSDHAPERKQTTEPQTASVPEMSSLVSGASAVVGASAASEAPAVPVTSAARRAAAEPGALDLPATSKSPGDPGFDEAISAVEEQFGLLVNRIRVAIRDRAERVSPGLQPAAYKLLTMAVRYGSVRAGSLAELLSSDKSSVSRMVHQLEGLGLLERQPDPDDGRASLIVATDEGRRRVNELRVDDQALLYRQMATWDRTDIERLAHLLAKLNDTI
ncbi:MarR family winged helix-turn-helix transcriptional regulator [Plantibacter sp. Mn2098]|uniref:MarR family winged helix-turn-helix transcriptional regulator n=1 Tax=Plantibacter sp. Mn2098 TaxID=3395266 RepID=UPI003BEC2E1E